MSKTYETSNKNRDSSNGNLKLMSVANIALVGEATFSHWKRKETIDNLMTILVMGYQSTNIALKWVIYDLAQNRHHQQKSDAEIKVETMQVGAQMQRNISRY